MRGLRLGLGPGRGRVGEPAAFAIAFTGLSTDSLGTYGQVGNHAAIGYTITPDNGTETVKWSASSNPADAATFGTGASPTTFASADGFQVYLHVTDGAETVTRSFTARYAPGAFGALTPQTFSDDSGDQTYVFSAAAGTGLTWTYSLVSPPSGVTIISATRTITFDTNALALQTDTPFTVRATDQYGRTIDQASTFTISPVLQLSAVDLQAQSGDDVPVALTGDAGTYNFILTTTDPAVSPPSLAQVNAGQTHTGAAAPASGQVTVVDATPVPVPLPDGLNGSYYLVVADVDSILFDATPQAIDTTVGAWAFSGSSITASPTVTPPTVSGSSITG